VVPSCWAALLLLSGSAWDQPAGADVSPLEQFSGYSRSPLADVPRWIVIGLILFALKEELDIP
jgi:hypothetical protein